MKKIVIALGFLISIYSCTSVKVLTVASDTVPLKNRTYIFENDTVKITYKFWAEKGIMSFDIYNKIDEPIYFDWKNSAYIPNSQMVSYWQDVTNTEGSSVSGSSWLYGGVVTKGRSKAVRQERIGVIPPHSLITKRDFKLVQRFKDLPVAGSYSKDNSFLNFRNYLMFSTNEKFEGKRSVVDNSFYVSDIEKVKYNKLANVTSDKKFFVIASYN